MKKTFDHSYHMERKFLFDVVRRAKEGGTVGFGVDPGENGSSIIKLELSGKVNDKPANDAAA